MLVNLLIVLLIIIVCCNAFIYSNKYKCPPYGLKIDYVRASRLPGFDYSDRVGIDTVNLKLDRDVPCGIYNMKTSYGNATLIVSKDNYRLGYMNIENMNIIQGINLFDLWDLERIESRDNQFIITYNNGCC